MTKPHATSRGRRAKTPSRSRRAHREPRRDTRDRILDAAERLFAQRGIDAVSVRSVLAAAGVNVSLAHYHFGGRDGLIEALLRRRLGPIMDERRRRLVEVEARGSDATVEDVLRAYYEYPSPEWLEAHPDFARLLAQLQFSPNPRIRGIVRDVLRDCVAPLCNALGSRLPPGLAPERRICRFYFVLGVGSFAAMNFPEMARSAQKNFGPEVVLDGRILTDEIVRFCAAGLRASAAGGQP